MSSQDESKSENDPTKEEKSANVPEVHSANSWERADLGDDERRQKFLRLMGASKKEHHGRFVIGDQDKVGTQARDKAKTDELNKELESQYQYSQEHKITRFSHTGLGFGDNKDEENKEEKKDDSEKRTTQEDTKDSKPEERSRDTGNNKTDGADRKRESTEPVKEEEVPPKKPKMMMSFVKASDS